MRTALPLVVVGLLLAACSGSSGSTPTPAGAGGATPAPATDAPATPATSAPTASAPAGAAPSPDPDDPLGFGDDAATATVVIGDTRYEFANLYCVTMGGAVSASSVGGDPRVDIDLPPMGWETSGDDGWDPPSVRVSGDEPYFNLQASSELAATRGDPYAASRVETFTSDGHQASGTATFLDASGAGAAPSPMPGSFEVSCPRP